MLSTDSAVHKKMLSSQSIPSFTTADFEELSNIYALEYNKPDLHDRVLVLDVVKDEREPIQIAVSLTGDEEEAKTTPPESPNSESTDKESKQSPLSQAKSTKRKNSQEGDDAPSVDKKKPRVLLSSEMEIETEDGHEAGNLTTEGEADVSSAGAVPEAKRGTVGELCSSTTLSDFSNSDLPRQHKIFVHNTWLAVHSSYFRSLFYSGLSESHLKEVHLKISKCEEKGHLLLLEAMYKPDILNEASVDDLLVVLELADKYQVKFVFRKCKYVLIANTTSIEACEKMVLVVRVKQHMTDVEDLIATITAFLVKTFSPNLDETWQRESFVNLSEVLLSCLLSSDDLTTQSENTVFHALMHWIKFNELDKSSEHLTASPLLSVVRFEFLTMDYLFCVVQHHPIATKMLHFNDAYLKGVTYHGFQEDAKKRLKVKPVERKTTVDDIVQYRWTVLSSEIASLTPNTGKLTSDVFWSCGYQMKITVGNLGIYCNTYRFSSINLHVLGLVQESFVPINFSFKYQNCKQIIKKLDYSHNFSLDSQMFSNTDGTLDLTKTEQSSNIDLIIKPQ